jgi:hypothetical protein
MKKVMLFKTVMASLVGFAVFACKPVEPEGTDLYRWSEYPYPLA